MEKEDFEDDIKDAGEIGSGHTVTVLYEVKMTDTYRNSNISDKTELTKEDNTYNWMTLKKDIKNQKTKKAQNFPIFAIIEIIVLMFQMTYLLPWQLQNLV